MRGFYEEELRRVKHDFGEREHFLKQRMEAEMQEHVRHERQRIQQQIDTISTEKENIEAKLH